MNSMHGRKSGSLWFLQLLKILGCITAVGLTTACVVFLGVGNWLVREDLLQKATAIVVLSGHVPVRALEAAEIYHEGYAQEIWLTHPGARSEAFGELGIQYPSENEINTQILLRMGVPPKAIRVLDGSIVNTADELEVIGKALRKSGGNTVIVVTNKAHTRRVHTLWSKYHASCGRVILHGVSDDPFEGAHWWRTTGDTQQVLRELMGMANTWAGLPVQSTLHVREPNLN